MHIGHNNMQSNYNMSNQQFATTDQQQDLGIIIINECPRVATTNREKQQNGQQSTGVHCPQFQVQKPRIYLAIMGIFEIVISIFW